MIRIEHPDTGRRLWLFGQRIHHGLIGALCATIGALLMAHDHQDWPWLK